MDINAHILNLKKIAYSISESNDKTLLQYSFGEPAPDSVIAKIQKDFFYGRESAVLELYKKMNGFQLIWNYSSKVFTDIKITPLIFLNQHVKFDGVINLLPIETAFDENIWKDTVWFENDSTKEIQFLDENTTNYAVKRRLIPIDFFSVGMSVATYANAENEYFLLLQDYLISYDESYVTLFEDYLNFVIATKGESAARFKAFNQWAGYKQPLMNSEQLLGNLNKGI